MLGLQDTLIPSIWSSPRCIYNHPEVDRIWGVYKERVAVLSRIIFYRMQDGCIARSFESKACDIQEYSLDLNRSFMDSCTRGGVSHCFIQDTLEPCSYF